MKHAATVETAGSAGYGGTIFAIVLCGLWVASIGTIGTLGFYEDIRSGLHGRVIVTVLAPTVIYALLFALLPAVRHWTHRLDLAMLTLPHAWRTVGFTFLALWFYGVLPAGFAAPAGFGDFAIAMAAPLVAVGLWLRWNGALRAAVWFHVLGMVDFFFALLTGISGYGASGEQMAQIDPMTAFPLVLIPTVAVPLLLVGHVMALLRISMQGD